MLLETLGAARDAGRLHEIASVFVRYGFVDLVDRLGLARALERTGRVLHAPALGASANLPPPERLRRALEELGPTFVKLGQVLASRVDLLAPRWIAELEKLQNQAPFVPWPLLEEQLARAWGGAPDQVFGRIDPEPLAAASIAQVHRAWLPDGSEVVVKIRRPAIRAIVAADLRLLERLARAFEAHSPELARYRPREIVRQFRASLERELDLAAECHHAERIAAALASMPQVVVPRVHWRWTAEDVNVQDYLAGPPLQALFDPQRAAELGADPAAIARLGAQAVLQMVFVDGFFHADPHGGNVIYLTGDRIGLIDFGMVGHLSPVRRRQLVRLLLALVEHDAERAAEVVQEWADGLDVDGDAMVDDLEQFLDRYHGVPLAQIRLGEMLGEVAGIVREHGLSLPPDLAMVVKVFVSLEGTGRRLDPAFDMVAAASPFVRRVQRQRYAPRRLAGRLQQLAYDATEALVALPQQLRRIVGAAGSGRLRLRVGVDELHEFGERVSHSANRLSLSLVISALIIGSSIVMTVDGGPRWLGLPFFGLAGFLAAVGGGVWLLLSILRSGGGR
jgi:ubiquinone biosynthesis protein